MAEAKTAKLGPWELKLVSIDDDISHAISSTTYPYKNGADHEDMGVNPETFKFSGILSNKDYDNNYQSLRKWFLSIFKKPVELFHPDHGTIYGYPKTASFRNDRRRRFCEFTFDFEVDDAPREIVDRG